MSEKRIPPEFELLGNVRALKLKTVETKSKDFMGVRHVRITLREDPDILSSCAFGLIYALGVLSFADARPRGYSEKHFRPKDDWFAGDMLENLRFEDGQLYFHADYVRGRMMKTTIEVKADGTVVVDTVDRGDVAKHWVAKLQGKQKKMRLVATPKKR